MSLWSKKLEMPAPETALPGRDVTMPVPPVHEVLGESLTPPFPEPSERVVFGMGCFWGAERIFWPRATQVASPRTPRTKKFEVGSPATTKLCWWSTTLGSLVMPNFLPFFGKTMIPLKECVKETTSVLSTDQVFMSQAASSEALPSRVEPTFKRL